GRLETNTLRHADGDRFPDRRLKQLPAVGIGPQRADRPSGQRRQARHRRQHDELHPDAALNVVAERGGDARLAAGGQQRLAARTGFAVGLAEFQAGKLAPLFDHTWRGDLGVDARHPTDDVVEAQHLADALDALDPVLQGKNRRPGTHEAAKLRRRTLGVAELDGENDGIGGGELVAGGRDLDRLQIESADLAVELQAPLAHRLQGWTSTHESDVISGRRQPRTKIAADATGTHNRNFHWTSPAQPAVTA